MATVSVTIDGKTYRMACDEGQEDHLAGLANRLDRYIAHLKTNFGEIGDHRLSVMAGIMVMDEMAEMQKQMSALTEETKSLREENARLQQYRSECDKSLAEFINQAADQIEALATHTTSGLIKSN